MCSQRTDRGAVGKLVGQSPWMVKLREDLSRLAGCDVNLLLEGESGTGKELAARTVHHHSRRRDGPFVAVNCAAIHESLLENELFGHAAGAFTGAAHATLGFFRAADGGTILLDEIGDMGPPLQSKLLRVLEERAVIPVGSTLPIPIDVRVIAATNHDLAAAVARGAFRRDLYYRLNVVRLRLEPLRRRRQDIPHLVAFMLERMAEALDSPPKSVSPGVLAALMRHDWPGNVRELGNVIQRAYVLGRGPVIGIRDLPEHFRGAPPAAEEGFRTLRELTRSHVQLALQRAGGVRTRAARLLGIDRKSLWRMIRRYRIEDDRPGRGPRAGAPAGRDRLGSAAGPR